MENGQVKCPQCEIVCASEQGLKGHLTRKHGGYTPEDLASAGVAPAANNRARAISSGGFQSIGDVAAAAPETEGSESREKAKRAAPGSREAREKQEHAARIKRALETVGKSNISSMAGIPYDAWAFMLGNPDYRLSDEEHDELVGAYMELAEAFGVDFTGKIWAIGAVVNINRKYIMARMFMMNLNDEERPGPKPVN